MDLKLKQVLGTIEVKLNNIEKKIEVFDGIKEEVRAIKSDFSNAVKIITNSENSVENIRQRFPKGGKSL